jgi:hypothetical protein
MKKYNKPYAIIALAIIISLFSGISTYYAVKYYVSINPIKNVPNKEVNVYLVLDNQHASKIIQDDIVDAKPLLDNTYTPRESI